MSTRTSESDRPTPRINGAVVVLGGLGGLVMAGAAVYAGSPWVGAGFLAIIWGYLALLVLGARVSDTVALIADDVHDERHVHIHQRAAIITLNLLALVIVGAFIVDIAQGGSGSPYSYLGLVGGVSYILTLVVLSRQT